MKGDDFAMFQTLLKQRSGLVLSRDKAYLLESRLMPVARKWNLRGLDELAQTVRSKKDERLLRDITEAMTTNESSFFRDTKPFDQLRSIILPRFLEARSQARKIRIWSAAASSGQEPYTIAMVLKEEAARLRGVQVEIVATDISTDILARAKSGLYTQFEVQRGLPVTLLVKYFRQRGDKWEISPDLRSMVTFREFNLLGEMRSLGQFDIVFCRNVLIYFDQPTKTKVLEGISRLLPPDGVLLLGGAETVLGVSDRFRPMDGQRGIYTLSAEAAPATRPSTPAFGSTAARQALVG